MSSLAIASASGTASAQPSVKTRSFPSRLARANLRRMSRLTRQYVYSVPNIRLITLRPDAAVRPPRPPLSTRRSRATRTWPRPAARAARRAASAGCPPSGRQRSDHEKGQLGAPGPPADGQGTRAMGPKPPPANDFTVFLRLSSKCGLLRELALGLGSELGTPARHGKSSTVRCLHAKSRSTHYPRRGTSRQRARRGRRHASHRQSRPAYQLASARTPPRRRSARTSACSPRPCRSRRSRPTWTRSPPSRSRWTPSSTATGTPSTSSRARTGQRPARSSSRSATTRRSPASARTRATRSSTAPPTSSTTSAPPGPRTATPMTTSGARCPTSPST